jgi:hypothetical protein
MKTAEDEAFEDIERRQGGGFKAKQAMAMDKMSPFEKWWYYESGCPPYTHHDCEEHTKRMCKIAWGNGAYVAAQPAQEPVECLDCGSNNVGIPATYDSLVNSIKSQPAQKPVAWQCREHGDVDWLDCGKENYGVNPQRWVYRKLYTTPPKREWVGLTDEEIAVVLTGDASLALNLEDLSPSWIELVQAVEAKLKEKNA